ncbi:6378_t:CDS:2 [Acaulospora morrowiae]|uniref:6378_t:CDS:1 n=1 Tax=Acaulospora morrowiae TaxID=94023 RepID=A0A9N9NF94_9GLOM|nr:6378_t:CDS:2 [Acaulospora morrowiae]
MSIKEEESKLEEKINKEHYEPSLFANSYRKKKFSDLESTSQPLTSATSSKRVRRPRLAWTSEEDEALFNAINSVLAGQWKDVCAKSPLLKARGTNMTSQRFKTKIRYFIGGAAERGKK